jgi:putative transposase
MDQHTVRQTYKAKPRPTPAQEQRITAYHRWRVSISRHEQEAELKVIRLEFSEYAAIHARLLQDALARLDKTYQACFRRVQRGEKAGFLHFKGRARYHSFTYKEYGDGARLDNGFLVLSKIGRTSVHWARPIEGAPKTITISHEADGWYVAISCADVPARPLPLTGQETGIDLGFEPFATLANGRPNFTPPASPARPSAIWRNASGASPVARREAAAIATRRCTWRRPIGASQGSDETSAIGKQRS